MRVWLLQKNNYEAEVIGANLRIGRQGSLVDNTTAGGLVSRVDLETGKLSSAMEGKPDRKLFSEHPDHGSKIEGSELPMLEDAIKIAKSALLAFPGIKFVGLDVAFSVDGPCIVEMNVLPDREGAVHFRVPTKYALSAP